MDDDSPVLLPRLATTNSVPTRAAYAYHPTSRSTTSRRLAAVMTIECARGAALRRRPRAASKSTHFHSVDEMRRVTRRFVSAARQRQHRGPSTTSPRRTSAPTPIMAWMADTYMNLSEPQQRLNGEAVVTGKPVEFGGSPDRDKATGQGILYVLEELLPRLKLDVSTLTFSLIGYGNVSSWTGRLLSLRATPRCGVMDPPAGHLRRKGHQRGWRSANTSSAGWRLRFPSAEPIQASGLLRGAEVDLFIPAAARADDRRRHRPRAGTRCWSRPPTSRSCPQRAGARRAWDPGVARDPVQRRRRHGRLLRMEPEPAGRDLGPGEPTSQLRSRWSAAARRTSLAADQYECDLKTAAYCAAIEHRQVYDIRGIFPWWSVVSRWSVVGGQWSVAASTVDSQ